MTAPEQSTDRIVTTTLGAVAGRSDSGVDTFLGIRYGASTGGPNRFRAPQPATPWEGVRPATEYGASCPQLNSWRLVGTDEPPEELVEMMEAAGVRAREHLEDEDCLCLNVWARSTDDPSARRPVLVWLHGGGWSTGSASWPMYDFRRLAEAGDVVVVGVNHRLGILGFLHLGGLDAERFPDAGNAGLLDIVQALEWVRDNAAAFGGDPNNVTIFGESGGGHKVTHLLSMPSAAPLFHKAFVMSGAPLVARTSEQATAVAWSALDRLECGLDDLQGLPVERLLDAEVELARSVGAIMTWVGTSDLRISPPIDGRHLHAHPVEAIAQGSGLRKPLLIGCTTDELATFVYRMPELFDLEHDGLHPLLEPTLRERTASVVDAYSALFPDSSAFDLYIRITSDQRMWTGHLRLAEAHVAAGGTAHLYSFACGAPGPDGTSRALHGWDMPYFFLNTHLFPDVGAGELVLSAAMAAAIAAFARTGDPGHPGLPDWPPFDAATAPTLVLDITSHLEWDPQSAERRIWAAFPHDAVSLT